MEEAQIEGPTMSRFASIDLISDRIPDETTILSFRHLLEKHELGEKIFETVNAHLSAAVSAWCNRSWRSLLAIVDDVSDVMGCAAYLPLPVIMPPSAMTAMPQFAVFFADCAG